MPGLFRTGWLSGFLAAAALALCVSSILAATPDPKAAPSAGVLPKAVDGHELNLDLEKGTLEDWTAIGNAFEGQPIQGDLDKVRPADGKWARPQGEYWIGTYERAGDSPVGVLTSVPFKVTHPFATFLVGGGHSGETRVEIVRKDNDQVVFKASGLDAEDLFPQVVDLKALQGQDIFVRIVDNASGGWGHINFDNFRFHEQKPVLPKGNPQGSGPDVYVHAGLSPEEAAAAMELPEGFKATLFAGEPDVVQPIAMSLDDRGRLWIVEAYSYPIRLPDDEAHDRILIFEDTNGDGKFDKRTVFAEKLNLVSGIAVGYGGVWVGAAPHFMFIPDADGDDRPDGPPQILLDGWGYQDTHETLNTFIWGPDGWLYGCHGVFTKFDGRQAGHARRQAAGDHLRHLALSSDTAPVRRFRPRHQQSLGRRFQRVWPRLFDRLRHPAPVLRDSRRRATSGRGASISIASPSKTSKPSPIIAITPPAADRTPATANRTVPVAATPMPAP